MAKTWAETDPSPLLKAPTFEKIRRLAYEKFGLNLTESKHPLVAARLGKKLRELKLPSYEAYYDLVQADRTGESLIALIDALSTNHTSFLREASHFDFLVEERDTEPAQTSDDRHLERTLLHRRRALLDRRNDARTTGDARPSPRCESAPPTFRPAHWQSRKKAFMRRTV